MRITKTIFTLLMIGAMLVGSAGAQQKRPTNLKLPPKTVAVKKVFESETGGFKAGFPSAPKITSKEVDFGGSKTLSTSYLSIGTTNFYLITHTDFPTPVTDETEISARYDNGRETLLQDKSRKLIEESDFYLNENLGRELVYVDDNVSTILRNVIVQQRYFQMGVGFPGDYGKSSPAVKKSFRKVADKFFESFEITTLPQPESEMMKLPETFDSMIEDDVFSSKYLGFSMNLPAEWKLLDSEEIELAVAIGRETKTERQQKMLNASLKNTRLLVLMGKTPTETDKSAASIAIAAESLGFANFDALNVMREIHKRDTQIDKKKSIIAPKILKISGVNFAVAENFNVESGFKQRLYLANRKGLALEIMVTYVDAKDAKAIEKLLETILFQ